MANVLIPVPDQDFDPTETGVPWRTLCQRIHRVAFATPNGKIARADPRMVTGEGLGVFAPLMKADRNGQSAYEQMRECEEFRHPIAYRDLDPKNFDGIILPGGHARGMREYLESSVLQSIVAEFFARKSADRRDLPRCAFGGTVQQKRWAVSSLWKKDDRSHQAYGANGVDAHPALSWRLFSNLSEDS